MKWRGIGALVAAAAAGALCVLVLLGGRWPADPSAKAAARDCGDLADPAVDPRRARAAVDPGDPAADRGDADAALAAMMSKWRTLAAEVKRQASGIGIGDGDARTVPHQGLVATGDATRTSSACKPTMRGARRALRVATLNLWNINAPWPARRDAIARTMERRAIDILAVQAVRYAGAGPGAGGAHQLAELAERLPELRYMAYLRVGPMAQGHEEGLGVRRDGVVQGRAPGGRDKERRWAGCVGRGALGEVRRAGFVGRGASGGASRAPVRDHGPALAPAPCPCSLPLPLPLLPTPCPLSLTPYPYPPQGISTVSQASGRVSG